MDNKKLFLFFITFLFAIPVMVYSPTVNFDASWDDAHILEYTNSLYGDGGLRLLVSSEFKLSEADTNTGYFRPVILLSFLANNLISPSGFQSHRITNILLHGLNCVLVFWMLYLITGSHSFSFFSALIFGLHAAHIENIALIAGRTDIIAFLFIVLTAISFIKSRRSSNHSLLWFCSVPVFFSLALLSKEISFVLPFFLFAIEPGLYHLPKPPPHAKSYFERNFGTVLVVLAVLALVFSIRYIAIGTFFGTGLNDAEIANSTISQQTSSFGEWVTIILYYIHILLFPLKTIAWYREGHLTLSTLATFVSGSYILFNIILSGRKHRYIGALNLLLFFCFILPVTGIFNLRAAVIAERFLYIPSMGYSIFLGYLFSSLWIRFQTIKIPLVLFLLTNLFFCTLVINNSRVWKDEGSLFGSALIEDKSGSYPEHAYERLSEYYFQNGQWKKLLDLYHRQPEFRKREGHLAYFKMGYASYQVKDYENSIKYYERAIRIDPDYFQAIGNLAFAYEKMNKMEEAIVHMQKVVEIAPEDATAHFNLGNLYRRGGKTSDAIQEYEMTLKINPDDRETINILVGILMETGQEEKARSFINSTMKVPGN